MAVKITRPQSTVELVTDAAVALELEAAAEEVSRLARESHEHVRLVSPDRKAAAQREADLAAQAAESTLVFTLQAVGKKRWNEIVAEHPPREGDDADKSAGVNTATFYDALISECILRVNKKSDGSVVDFDPAEEWQDLADEMTDGQFAEFVASVQELNRGLVRAPFPSRLASRILESDATSN